MTETKKGCDHERHAESAADIREYMSGNLCRYAAYPNIVAAINQAKAVMRAFIYDRANTPVEALRAAIGTEALSGLGPSSLQSPNHFLAGGTTRIAASI